MKGEKPNYTATIDSARSMYGKPVKLKPKVKKAKTTYGPSPGKASTTSAG